MTKALSVDVGYQGTKAVKMLSGNPKGAWERIDDRYKYMAYLNFGADELADVVGRENVRDLEVQMVLDGNMERVDAARTVIENPGRFAKRSFEMLTQDDSS